MSRGKLFKQIIATHTRRTLLGLWASVGSSSQKLRLSIQEAVSAGAVPATLTMRQSSVLWTEIRQWWLTASPGNHFSLVCFFAPASRSDLAVVALLVPFTKATVLLVSVLNKATRKMFGHLKSSARYQPARTDLRDNLTRTLDSKICIRRTILLSYAGRRERGVLKLNVQFAVNRLNRPPADLPRR